jgi:hypothetical protein
MCFAARLRARMPGVVGAVVHDAHQHRRERSAQHIFQSCGA